MAVPGKGCAKTLAIVLGLALVLAGVGVVLLNTRGMDALRRTAETRLTEAVGSRVEVGRLAPEIRNGVLVLENVRVMNPAGFAESPALEHGRVRVTVDPRTLLSSEPVIREIVVDDTTVYLQHELAHGLNLRALIDQARARAGAEPGDAPRQRWRVDTLRSDGARVLASSNILPAASVELNVEPFELTEFDGDPHAGLSELAAALLRDYGRRALAPGTLVAPLADALRAALGATAEEGGRAHGHGTADPG